MEASLLPSERFRALAAKAALVGVREADPACKALRKEFDARATGWVIVLDRRGELLDCGMADETGALKTKEGCAKFPDLVSDRIERSLRRTETLQDLERTFEKAPSEEAPFEKLASRLEELKMQTRLRALCERVAALPGLPAERRSGALLLRFVARSREFSREFGSFGPPDAGARLIEDGERLLADHASHARAAGALEALFVSGYALGFDVPARSAAGIARLEKMAEGLKEPAPLRERIVELAVRREKEIEKLQAARAAAKAGSFTEAWYALTLGDAERTIDFFSKPSYYTQAPYRRWVEEAREKLKK
jgi:hypothetical protein